MKTKTPRMILMGAAWYLKQHGWQKGNMGKHGGPRCIFGALFSAAEVPTQDDNPKKFVWQDEKTPLGRAAEELRKIISWQTGTRRVYDFNDYHCRNQDDAIEMLERAADRTWDHSLEAANDRAQRRGGLPVLERDFTPDDSPDPWGWD